MLCGRQISKVEEAQLLGITIHANTSLSWDTHVHNIVKKASKRIYYIVLLKRYRLPSNHITQVYTTLIRPILEYCCQLWHFRLTKEQSDLIERLQKRVCKIVFNDCSYDNCLTMMGINRLSDRRQRLCKKLFKKITHCDHKLHNLLPSLKLHGYDTRSKQVFQPYKCRTNRFKQSFLPASLREFDI